MGQEGPPKKLPYHPMADNKKDFLLVTFILSTASSVPPIFFLTSCTVRPEPFCYNKVQIVLHDLIKGMDKKRSDMFEEPLPCHLISRRGKKFALTTAPYIGGMVSCIVCVWG